MPRGITAKQPKRKARARRAPKYNRELVVTKADVLRMATELSGVGHPHDYIPEDAVIETKNCGRGKQFVIRWQGVPVDHTGYGAEPWTPESTAALAEVEGRAEHAAVGAAALALALGRVAGNFGLPLEELLQMARRASFLPSPRPGQPVAHDLHVLSCVPT